MGVNVVYAPCLDLATDPRNPSIGIRSFGADPGAVSGLAAAWTRGLRSAGVAATAKHFPGKGAVTQDSHHVLPVLDLPRETLAARELAPFRASIEAGADLVMSAHVAMTAYSGDATLPATLDPAVMTGLLRDELGFDGLTISDALDMRALPQGPEQAIDAVVAMRAGIDLLLLTPDPDAQTRVETAVRHAAARGLLERGALERSSNRLARLRGWLAGFEQPPVDVVGSAEHRALARELAERSITLVRDDAGLLPLRLAPDARLLAIMPRPRDLTPADTSSQVEPGLGAALRACHPRSDEFVTSHPPTDAEIAEARAAGGGCRCRGRRHDLGLIRPAAGGPGRGDPARPADRWSRSHSGRRSTSRRTRPRRRTSRPTPYSGHRWTRSPRHCSARSRSRAASPRDRSPGQRRRRPRPDRGPSLAVGGRGGADALRRDGLRADAGQPVARDRLACAGGARRRDAGRLRGRGAARLAHRGPVHLAPSRGRARPGIARAPVARGRRRLVGRVRASAS